MCSGLNLFKQETVESRHVSARGPLRFTLSGLDPKQSPLAHINTHWHTHRQSLASNKASHTWHHFNLPSAKREIERERERERERGRERETGRQIEALRMSAGSSTAGGADEASLANVKAKRKHKNETLHHGMENKTWCVSIPSLCKWQDTYFCRKLIKQMPACALNTIFIN